ncbi:uncharacterized protein LOC106665804 isoform X2 [Cimex lectularius]|uniref:Uncharacterized protein n=1 Tax=Cimex lectularius TaxID=79782 RepID=A0A8I6RN59_CIMLE|nr:uncharacterized protein LOC106665804 isoform X2 [Cimex lectularius]
MDKSSKYQEVEDEEQAAIKIQAAFKGYKVRKTMAAEPTKAELEAEFSADDKELCNAATKIQASFRGHQARAQKGASNAKVEELRQDMQKMAPTSDAEELDIDLSDPDLHKAATKIQASFRGHKVRKDDK